MANIEETQGNPDEQFGSENFFDEMERQVNGAIIDEDQPEKETLSEDGPVMETHQEQEDPVQEAVDWEKRYKDSSREATKMRDRLGELKPFVPLLQAMKNDSGLINHVRDYLKEGGKPAQSVKDQLGLAEDFIFDSEEAFSSPDSDSAKLMNAHVDGLVQSRVKGLMNSERQTVVKAKAVEERKKEAAEFMQRHNMSEDEFRNLVVDAKSRRMTLDDIYYLLNRDKANANVAKSTKQDMMNQMKNVRDIPTTAGGVNSPRSDVSQDDKVFENLMGADGGLDDLFG